MVCSGGELGPIKEAAVEQIQQSVSKMSAQLVNMFCNKQTMKDEKLLNDKIYFLNKSRTKYVVVGLSPSVFQPVIKICSLKSSASVQFTEDEWLAFWNNEGIFANYLTYQNTSLEVVWEKEKCYSLQKINNAVVLKIADVSCAAEIYIGKESFWNFQHVRYSVNILLEEFKMSNVAKSLEEFQQILKNEGNCQGRAITVLEQRRKTLSFLAYCAIMEYILFHPDA